MVIFTEKHDKNQKTDNNTTHTHTPRIYTLKYQIVVVAVVKQSDTLLG